MGRPTTKLSWNVLKARNDPEYKKKWDERRKQWWRDNKEKHRESVRKWYQKLPDAKAYLREQSRRFYATNPTGPLHVKTHAWKWRINAMEALGGTRCAHCGFDKDVRALVVDHINGGGQAEMRAFNYNLVKLLKTIVAMPEAARLAKYQVLCANCNRIKQFENGEFGRGPAYYRRMKETK